jgi:hypothetical protein
VNSETINALNCYRRLGYADVSEDFADEINSIPDAEGKQEFVKREVDRVGSLFKRISRSIIEKHCESDFEDIVIACKMLMDRDSAGTVVVVGDMIFDEVVATSEAKGIARSIEHAIAEEQAELKTVFEVQEVIWSLDFALKSLTDWEFASEQVILVKYCETGEPADIE